LDIQIREVATSSAGHQNLLSNLITAVENNDLPATTSRGKGAKKTSGTPT